MFMFTGKVKGNFLLSLLLWLERKLRLEVEFEFKFEMSYCEFVTVLVIWYFRLRTVC